MLNTSIREGQFVSGGCSVRGIRDFGGLATMKVVPAGLRQKLAAAAGRSKAAVGRGGAFKQVLPLNYALVSDACAAALRAFYSAPQRER